MTVQPDLILRTRGWPRETSFQLKLFRSHDRSVCAVSMTTTLMYVPEVGGVIIGTNSFYS